MSQAVNSYKELKFWIKAKEVCLLTFKLTKLLPNERASWIIIDQILRSAFSVGANIAEGFGEYKGKDYARFIQMALSSARETECWLELMIDLFPQLKERINKILEINTEVIKMLVVTLNSLRRK